MVNSSGTTYVRVCTPCSLQYLVSKCIAQNTFCDICRLVQFTNSGYFEAGIPLCYKRNIPIIITSDSAIEFFIASSSQIINSCSLIIF